MFSFSKICTVYEARYMKFWYLDVISLPCFVRSSKKRDKKSFFFFFTFSFLFGFFLFYQTRKTLWLDNDKSRLCTRATIVGNRNFYSLQIPENPFHFLPLTLGLVLSSWFWRGMKLILVEIPKRDVATR